MNPEPSPAPVPGHLYTYKAKVIKITDGDTIRVGIDLGFGITTAGLDGQGVALRLLGVDTPELKGGTEESRAAARAARYFVEDLIPVGTEIMVRTVKDKTDKYGRYLAEVSTMGGVSVNEVLLAEGHAKEL